MIVSDALAAEAMYPPTVDGVGASSAVHTMATDVARLQLLVAAASGDTARELQPLIAAEALGPVGAVLTRPLRREALVRSGASFTAKFWAATETLAGVASVDAWQAREADLTTSPMG
ncbi:MAG: hypothetical protein EOP39_08920, partial [Rubrivivax sp.]